MSGLYTSLADPIALAVVVGCGLVLLLFGGRILRPAVVLGALVVSAALGLRLAVAGAGGGFLGMPPLAWIIGTPIAGVALALVLYRLSLAALFALASATAGFLLTVTLIMALATMPNQGPAPSSQAIDATSERQAEDSAGGQPTPAISTPVLQRIQALARDAAGQEAPALLASGLDEVAVNLSQRIDQGVAAASGWLAGQAAGIPPALRTMGLAVATVCGLLGLAMGLLLPGWAARTATAVVGSWLLVTALAATWVQYGSGPPGPPPVAVLVAWAVLAGTGALVQSRQRRDSADEKP